MKRNALGIHITVLILAAGPMAVGDLVIVGNTATDSFENAWSGDYAAGWANGGYRWGTPSTAVMAQSTTARTGSYGVQVTLTAAGDPVSSTNWWGSVVPTGIPTLWLAKENNPTVSVAYYDNINAGALPSGYLSAVPDTDIPDDWTDVQFGTRWNRADHYWYGNGSVSGFSYTESDVARTQGWHEFAMNLAPDGILSYYIDDALVGTAARVDFLNLAGVSLGVWNMDGVYPASVIFDDFKIQSTAIPAPGAVVLGMIGFGLVGWVKRRLA